jgi:hypothetical protein
MSRNFTTLSLRELAGFLLQLLEWRLVISSVAAPYEPNIQRD